MASKTTARKGTGIDTYRAKRNFTVTSEPQPSPGTPSEDAPIFIVQKHQARRAGLHWDFRLEHNGVLWSWAVRKGPSLDPADRRLAAHVEDHPLDYASFEGTIAEGNYGAGTVELWDRGTWQAVDDPDAGMAKGHLHFVLHGRRLHGRWNLVRLANRDARKSEAWFLIKSKDDAARPGIDAAALEQEIPPPPNPGRADPDAPPAPGALRRAMPPSQAPQLAETADAPPETQGWLSEIKFDGYRILAIKDGAQVHLLTRNGHDWTDRLPALAAALAAIPAEDATLDGELVALRPDGTSSFPDLQDALSSGHDGRLHYMAFDLLHLNGWDLRPCRLADRKRVLSGLTEWDGLLRFSDHIADAPPDMRRRACAMGLEGIVCKRADAPYRAGRSAAWLKVKCQGREEFLVIGWTDPSGSRQGLGSLQLGYHDKAGALHYAGGVGTGFSDATLRSLRRKLDALAADLPADLRIAGDPLDKAIHWVRPELVAEIQFTAWAGAGRVRHAVFLGLREDKPADQVIRDIADPGAERRAAGPGTTRRRTPKVVPPAKPARIVQAARPKARTEAIAGVTITHPDRELWPGVTKRDLAAYWQTMAPHALPLIARRPLAIVRCPEGIAGERFFQKSGHHNLPAQIREGSVDGVPYLAIDDVAGLVALAQVSTLEIHPWGAPESDPDHPDWMVFDLDPGEGVGFPRVVEAALEVRGRLEKLGLHSFCRTTGGKGLHVVAPLDASAGWDRVKPFCRAFAEAMTADAPDRFVAHVKIADRRGKILVDWLRNGRGATAVASFSPRARPGAAIATPLAWSEVKPGLDPAAFTPRTVPARVARQRRDPWEGFFTLRQSLPAAPPAMSPATPNAGPPHRARIVQAARPRRHA